MEGKAFGGVCGFARSPAYSSRSRAVTSTLSSAVSSRGMTNESARSVGAVLSAAMVPVVVISASPSVAGVEVTSDVEGVSCEDSVLIGKLDSSLGEDVVAVMGREAVIEEVLRRTSLSPVEDRAWEPFSS